MNYAKASKIYYLLAEDPFSGPTLRSRQSIAVVVCLFEVASFLYDGPPSPSKLKLKAIPLDCLGGPSYMRHLLIGRSLVLHQGLFNRRVYG